MKRKILQGFLAVCCFGALLLTTSAYAQKLVKGKVTSASDNSPLTGASVQVKGSSEGTVTGPDGSYSLTVPGDNSRLVISYIGFNPQEITVGGRSSINVSLSENTHQLNALVVTALGISKEESKVGYSVTSVNGSSMDKARETNVALSLAGRVAGLDVHGTSGGPGGTARILLRGMPSMNSGGAPLFVINGVPMDNSQRGSAGEWGGSDNGDGIGNLNPDDIASMTILKGQAASALYGARASNGVIMITTKSGNKGFAVDYNLNYEMDKPIDYTDYQYVYGQGLYGAKPANATAAQNSARFSWGAKLDGSQVIGFDGKQYAYSPYKDNIANFYRSGSSVTNTVAVSGGGDKGSFRLSLSNLSNQSIVRNSGIDRKTVNLNVKQKITDKLEVTVMENYIQQEDKNQSFLSDGPGNPNNGLFLANNINENILKPGYDASGNEVVFSDDPYVTNPWFVVNKWINNLSRKRLISDVSAKYNFTDWLYIQSRLGYDLENDRGLGVTPTGTAYSFNSKGQSGSIGLSTAQTSELNLDGLIGATHSLTKDLGFNATIGANLRKNYYENIGISGSPFVIPSLYTPSNVVSFGRSYSISQKEVHSAFYTVDLNYKSFLTLNTTGRYDAYSTLPSNNRGIFTPSVSGSFIFSELAHIPQLSFGQLRASYAQTSGEPGTPYQTSVYYGVGNSINGTPTGNFSSGLPNLFLKPFTLTEIEFGTKLQFFNNRLGFDITYFTRTTHHEIMNTNLSAATGYTSSVIATGSTLNNGLELQVTGTPVTRNNFSWNITFNLTSVHNKILQTDPNGKNVNLGTYRPLNANTAFVKGMAGPQILAHDYTYDAQGHIIVDNNGLPIRGGLVPMGSVLPTLYGGLNNDFNFGNFDLSFLIDYNYGNKILSATSYYTIYRGLNKMTLPGRETGIITGVTQDGKPNAVAAKAQDYYQRLAGISRLDVLNGDYIKLRQVTFGYAIPEKAFERLPLFSSVTISLVARNLLTLMKHSDNIDPEAGFNASVGYAGIEGTSLPSTRTFGINASFKFKK